MRDLLNYLLLNKSVMPFLRKLKEQLQLLLPGSRGYIHIAQCEPPWINAQWQSVNTRGEAWGFFLKYLEFLALRQHKRGEMQSADSPARCLPENAVICSHLSWTGWRLRDAVAKATCETNSGATLVPSLPRASQIWHFPAASVYTCISAIYCHSIKIHICRLTGRKSHLYCCQSYRKKKGNFHSSSCTYTNFN